MQIMARARSLFQGIHRGGELRARVVRAAGISTTAFFISQVLRLGGNLVLARLLAPEMFGIMSFVLVVQLLLTMLSDIGLRLLIVQSERGDEPIFLNTIWTIQVIRGVAIAGCAAIISLGIFMAGRLGYLPAGAVVSSPELPLVLAVSGLAAIFTGFQSTRVGSHARRMDVTPVVKVELLGQLIAMVAMIGLAYVMGSVWAIVWANLLGALATTVLSHTWLQGIRNSFAFELATRMEVVRKGGWILASSLVTVVASSFDRLVLSGLIGAATMGLYSIALSLAAVLEQIGGRLLESVVITALSTVARENFSRFRSALLKLKIAFDLWSTGAAGLLFAVAPQLIEFLYDDRYRDAGWMLQILSFGILFARLNFYNAAYLALGHTKIVAAMSVCRLASLAVMFSTGYFLFGLEGGLFGIAFQAAPLVPVYLYLNGKYGLNHLGVEVATLAGWPIGFAAGTALSEIARIFFHHVV